MKIFKIGDPVKYRDFRGKIIKITPPTSTCSGYYKISFMENGVEKYFEDYHYVFELDIQEDRNQKINELLS